MTNKLGLGRVDWYDIIKAKTIAVPKWSCQDCQESICYQIQHVFLAGSTPQDKCKLWIIDWGYGNVGIVDVMPVQITLGRILTKISILQNM
jgi:ArsR family metal-binding transcriptional regulator